MQAHARPLDIAAITNDIYTKEDARIPVEAGALAPERIIGVETGGCPHTAIREDASINLAAIAEMSQRFPDLDLILIELGGDNLAATFSPELADLTIYVIDVSGGEKIPRKGGPGITRSDLLVINKIDLAPYVGASLDVMARDAARDAQDAAFRVDQHEDRQGRRRGDRLPARQGRARGGVIVWRAALTQFRHGERFAAVAGLERNSQARAAVDLGPLRHDSDDGRGLRGLERRGRVGMAGELPQIPLGREQELEPRAIAFERFARRNPDRIDRLPAVVRERVIRRGEREEEMGVEALGQEGWRNPAGEGNEGVGRRSKVLARHESGEGRAAVERAHALRGNEPRIAPRSRQQHAAFLERLADRGDPDGPRRLVESRRRQARRRARRSASADSSPPPGKTSAPEAKSIS